MTNQQNESGVNNWSAAIVTLPLGVGVGFVVSVSGFAVICVCVVLGFALGAFCSYVAASYRVLFGVAGNLAAAMTALSLAVVRVNARPGVDTELIYRELPGMLFVVLAALCVPGLLGSWAVVAAKRPA